MLATHLDYPRRITAAASRGQRAAGDSYQVTGDGMALMPCTYCDRVPRRGLRTLIWAWYVDRQRVAVRTRACSQCVDDALVSFGEALPQDGDYVQLPTSCQLCSDVLEPSETVEAYCTAFDGGERSDLAFATCQTCAGQRHESLLERGERMADRPLYQRRR